MCGRSQLALVASARFDGVGDGIETFDCKAERNAKPVDEINRGILEDGERNLQTVVLLVGSTDRKPLSPALRGRFASNAGLARARARVDDVERCLTVAARQSPSQLIRLVTGSSYTPAQESAEVASKKMGEDRDVLIFVLSLPVRNNP